MSAPPKTPKDASIVALTSLLTSSKYSDLALECGGKEFKVHRAILCPRSPVFEAECDGAFSEAQSGRIKIGAPSASVDSIQRMIDYIYKNDYDDAEPVTAVTEAGVEVVEDNVDKTADADEERASHDTEAAPPPEEAHGNAEKDEIACEALLHAGARLINNVHVYGLAEYYQIPDLKHIAFTKIKPLLLADVQKYAASKGCGTKEAEIIASVIKEVYDLTGHDDRLRQTVVSYVAINRHKFTKSAKFLADVSYITDFTSALVVEIMLCSENELACHTDEWAKKQEDMQGTINDLTGELNGVSRDLERVKEENLVAQRAKKAAERQIGGERSSVSYPAGRTCTACRHVTFSVDIKGQTWMLYCNGCKELLRAQSIFSF